MSLALRSHSYLLALERLSIYNRASFRFLFDKNSFSLRAVSLFDVLGGQFSSRRNVDTFNNYRFSWLFYVRKAENSATIVGRVVFIADWSTVEGYRLLREVIGRAFRVAEFLWQQHFCSRVLWCGQLGHRRNRLVDFFI